MEFESQRHHWADREIGSALTAGALKAPAPHQPLREALSAAVAPAASKSGNSRNAAPSSAQRAAPASVDYVAAPQTPVGGQGPALSHQASGPVEPPTMPQSSIQWAGWSPHPAARGHETAQPQEHRGCTGLCIPHPAAPAKHSEPLHQPQAYKTHGQAKYLSPLPGTHPGQQGFLPRPPVKDWPTGHQEQSGQGLVLSQQQLHQHMPSVSPVTPHSTARSQHTGGGAGHRFPMEHITPPQHTPSFQGPPLTPAAPGERSGWGMGAGPSATELPHVRMHGSGGPTSPPHGRLSLTPTGAAMPGNVGSVRTPDIFRSDQQPSGSGVGLQYVEGRVPPLGGGGGLQYDDCGVQPPGAGVRRQYEDDAVQPPGACFESLYEGGVNPRSSAASDCLALLEDAQRQLKPFGRSDRWKKQGLDRKDLPDDGHSWHKYGHKTLMGLFSRAYYRCTQRASGCRAKKTVDTTLKGSNEVRITYDGVHNHRAEKGAVDSIIVTHRPPEAALRPHEMPLAPVEPGPFRAANVAFKRKASPSPPASQCASKHCRVLVVHDATLPPAAAGGLRNFVTVESNERQAPKESQAALCRPHRSEAQGSGRDLLRECEPAAVQLPAEYTWHFGHDEASQRGVSVSPCSEDSTVHQAPTPRVLPLVQDEPSWHWRPQHLYPQHSRPQHWGGSAQELPTSGTLALMREPKGPHVGGTRIVDLELKL